MRTSTPARLFGATTLLVALAVLGTVDTAAAKTPQAPATVMADRTYMCNRPGLVPANALCAPSLANLNIRTGPGSNHAIVSTMWVGADFWLHCWVPGQSVNGDNVWYWGTHITGPWPPDFPVGYAAGYYLGTGPDPHPAVRRC